MEFENLFGAAGRALSFNAERDWATHQTTYMHGNQIIMRGADLLIATLAKAGVRRIFSLSGNQIMPVYDACIDAGIEIVHTRHEAAAVFMADAWAQMTGEIGVALVTAAPGFGNALGALYTASGNESPVLFLSGDAPVGMDGRGAFQEFDQVSASRPFTKFSRRVMTADAMASDTAEAIRTAMSGRSGPVHLALPFDVLNAKADTPQAPEMSAFAPAVAEPSADDLAFISAALTEAKRPIIVCGPLMNVTRAPGVVQSLQDAFGCPAFAMESPRGLNDPALGAIAQAFANADLVVSLGKRIDFTLGFGAEAKFGAGCRWIAVDADGAALEAARGNLGDRLVRAVSADPQAVAKSLSAQGSAAPERSEWVSEVSKLIAQRNYSAIDQAPAGAITPIAITQAVQRAVDANPGAILICDGGEFGQWSQAGVSSPKRLTNGPAGSIGGCLCYALGARAAAPESVVITMMGDGTVGFQFAEFETAVRDKLPFVAIVGNDQCWNAEHQIQMREYGPDRLIGCQLSGARYDLAVSGLGGHGEYVTDPSQLDAALQRAISSGLPACLNIEMAGFAAPTISGKSGH